MIAIINEIRGLPALLRKLKDKAEDYEKGNERGLKRCAALLLRESMKIVPVDTGFLRRSGSWSMVGKGLTAKAMVGYSAAYSIFVHENLEARHKPGKSAKFLEQPYRDLQPEFLRIMREEMTGGKKGRP